MSEFVPVVTDGMADSFSLGAHKEKWTMFTGIRAAIAHEDFQRQLRAYVAEQMRGLVPDEMTMAAAYFRDIHPRERLGHNACRAETLANIAKWESSNGQ